MKGNGSTDASCKRTPTFTHKLRSAILQWMSNVLATPAMYTCREGTV